MALESPFSSAIRPPRRTCINDLHRRYIPGDSDSLPRFHLPAQGLSFTDPEKEDPEHQAALFGVPVPGGAGTLIFCPVRSPAPVPSPFAWASSTRVMRNFAATLLSVSPRRTTYVELKMGGWADGTPGRGAGGLNDAGTGNRCGRIPGSPGSGGSGCSDCTAGACTVVYVWLTNWGTSEAGVLVSAAACCWDEVRDLYSDQATITPPMTATHAHIGSGPSLWVNTFPPPRPRSGAGSLMPYAAPGSAASSRASSPRSQRGQRPGTVAASEHHLTRGGNNPGGIRGIRGDPHRGEPPVNHRADLAPGHPGVAVRSVRVPGVMILDLAHVPGVTVERVGGERVKV